MDPTSTQTSNRIKQVLVVRKDLDCRRGKLYSQVAHASMAFITRRLIDITYDYGDETHALILSEVEQQWLNDSFVKICVGVDSEMELLDIKEAAEEAGVVCHLVQDEGRTEFHGVPTYTCLALGPDLCARIDPLTSRLLLL